MSRLEELIAELCPDGVEYKRLEECCYLQKGTTPIQKAIPGEYPLVVTTDERKSSNTYQFDAPTVCIPLVSSRGHGIACLNQVYYQEGKFALGNILCGVTPKDNDILLASFLYHYLNYKKDTLIVPLMKGGANVSLTVDSLKRIKVPVPPIEVQIKIINILDSFIALSTELKAELTARKKQYEYYRDKLLNFDVHGGGASEVEWRTLGEVCFVCAGGTPSKKNNSYWENGTIKWLGSSVCQNQKNVDKITDYITESGLKNSSAKIMRKGSTLIALVGATIGKVAFLSFEAAINQNIAGVYPVDTNRLNPSFVYYTCAMLYPQFMGLTQGKLAMANLSFVRGLQIPVPPLKEQLRIVSILDRFDALCNDLTSGLPAEIEARQKQYEYYRDKLLTFRELSI